MDTVFVWYRSLVVEAARYGVPLMPFEAIVLSYGANGLCIPGIGVHLFTKRNQLLYEILSWTLPLSDNVDLRSQHASTSSRNG